MAQDLSVNQGTIEKVYTTLASHGIGKAKASKVLEDLYSQGLVFRERMVVRR